MLEQIACPLCGNKNDFLKVNIPDRDDHIESYGSIYAGYKKSVWKVCGVCGFVHQNPRPTLKILNQYYKESKYHGRVHYDKDELLKDYKPVAYGHEIPRLIKDCGIKKGSVFDLGCGLGFALKDFRDEHGWECYGIEPDKDKSDFAIKSLGLKNVFQGMFDAKFRLKNNKKVDLVFSHHVWEHIADFDQVLRGVKAILRKDGFFFASMPTYYRNRSHMSKLYMNSSHYSSFNHFSMSQLLARYGFECYKFYYHNRAGRGVTDDLQFLARYTGNQIDPRTYYEDPKSVQRYTNFINPMRSLLYGPIYTVRYVYGFNKIKYQYIPRLKGFLYKLRYLKSPKKLFAKISEKMAQK